MILLETRWNYIKDGHPGRELLTAPAFCGTIDSVMLYLVAAVLLAAGGDFSPLSASSVPARPAAQAPAKPVAPAQGGTREVDAYYEFLLGRHLESTGDIENAIKAYQRAALADPASAEIPAELAALYARHDRAREAITSAEAALQIDPANVEAHRVLGMVYAVLGRPDDPSSASEPDLARHTAEAIRHLEAAARSTDRVPEPGLQLLLARLYVATRQFGRAIPVLEEFLGQQGDIADAAALLADAYTETGRAQDATALLARAAQTDPQLYPSLAESYERQQRWKDAADAYEQASRYYSRNSELKTRWAMALLSERGGQGAAKARDLLGEVLKDSPADARAVYLLAQAQRTLKDLGGAEQSARRLMVLRPNSASGPEMLAQIYAERNEPEDVIALLEPLVSPDKAGQKGIPEQETTPLLVHLGFAYAERGDFGRAIRSFERAREQAPSDATLALYLAQAHLEAGHVRTALDLVREARADGLDDPRIARLEAEALRRDGKTGQGADVLRKAVAARPDDPMGYLALAEFYSGSQRHGDALSLLRDAESRFPDDLTVVFQQGAVLERAKQYAEAEAIFRRVIAKDPLHALALNYLGYMMADRGERLDEAIGYLKRALAIEPRNGAYLDSLGWAYFRQNKLDLAEANLRLAAESRVRDSAIQDHYGDLLAKLGRHVDAVAAWERALAGDGEQIDRTVVERKIKAAKEKIKRR